MCRILIADDSKFMRHYIKKILIENGFKVIEEAEDGLEAVQKYMKLKPDLVLMDITMKVMSGMDALRLIKKIDNNAKVIICSAMGQQQLIIEALNLGAKDFIVKPFLKDKILECINKHLQNYDKNIE